MARTEEMAARVAVPAVEADPEEVAAEAGETAATIAHRQSK